jgi:hypothetical protein
MLTDRRFARLPARRLVTVLVLTLLGAATVGRPTTFADDDVDATGDESVGYDTGADGDTITATVDLPDAVVPGTPGSSTGDCHWRYYSFSVTPGDDPFAQRAMFREHPVTGQLQMAVDRVCAGDVVGVGWVDATPAAPEVMLAGPRAEVTRRLPAPVPDLDPVDDATVHLGMWLAVRPMSPVTAVATVGGYRASVTATHTATVFAMGDGRVVRCAGHGTPLRIDDPRRNDPAPGPCGYVYDTPTPVGRPHTVTVTAEWTVVGVTPQGRRDLGTLTTSTPVTMTVREVQTIGRG